jgi:hypothetical protein
MSSNSPAAYKPCTTTPTASRSTRPQHGRVFTGARSPDRALLLPAAVLTVISILLQCRSSVGTISSQQKCSATFDRRQCLNIEGTIL